MRKIITTTMLTLDGVMQAPGASKEDTAEGFKYGGWQVGWDEEADAITDRIQAKPFDLLLGRLTYEIFAGYWPRHSDEPHWGKAYDRAKKYVVSHKPIDLSWDNSELITGDAVEEIKKLKNTDGPDLWMWGSSNLIQTLLKNNLIDRMYLWIFPVTIGTGKKLFAEGTRPERFKVVDSKILSSGLIFAAYEPAGPLNE
ncbi:MAG TPA: dihydrofolate reductase family protein [Patescibacteria group bacterium]|nr:dihydrofolate reductase family protein [Patescibacteria group bacterium]